MSRGGIFPFLFCICSLLPAVSAAQSSRIDSIKLELKKPVAATIKLQLLNKLSEEFAGVNPDSAEVYAFKAIDLARELKNKREEAIALKNLGWAVAKKGEQKEAIRIYREGLSIAKEVNDKIIQGDIYRSTGVAYYQISLYDSALVEQFNALNIFKEERDTTRIAGVLNNIGNIYYFMKNDSGAVQYYTEALEIFKRTNDKSGLAKEYGNLGLISIRNDDTLKAVEYAEKSLEYYLQTNEQGGIATSYLNLGMAYEGISKWQKALECIRKALEIRKAIGDKRGIAVATVFIGNAYFEMEDYNKAIENYKVALPLCRELKLRAYIFELLASMAKSYTALGRYREAAELYPTIISIKDSIYNVEVGEKVAGLEAQYKAEMEAQYQTKEKDTQIKIQELSLKRRSTYLWGAAGFIGLLWIILAISYIAYRNKEKTNALLAKKNNEITRQKKEITDSINYAQTIQKAILPHEKLLEKYLPDSFVIFKPKDIVSGDFYWTLRLGGEGREAKDESPDTRHPSFVPGSRVYFAAVDCTGHGVPGAFMSIIGHNSLNRTVKDLKLVHPADILDKLVELVTEALRAENQGEVKDGMDLSLCCLYPDELKLEYAGAYNPLYIVRKNEVLEFKADRQPIGSFEKRKPFTNHEIQLEKGDCIYGFSDGVIDQFGGEKGKKLGSKRLKEILLSVAHLTTQQQYTELKTRFENWQGTQEQTDDVTLIGVKV